RSDLKHSKLSIKQKHSMALHKAIRPMGSDYVFIPPKKMAEENLHEVGAGLRAHVPLLGKMDAKFRANMEKNVVLDTATEAGKNPSDATKKKARMHFSNMKRFDRISKGKKPFDVNEGRVSDAAKVIADVKGVASVPTDRNVMAADLKKERKKLSDMYKKTGNKFSANAKNTVAISNVIGAGQPRAPKSKKNPGAGNAYESVILEDPMMDGIDRLDTYHHG